MDNGWAADRFMRKLQLHKEKLKKWNKDDFSTLSICKNELLVQIEQMDKMME